MLTELEFVNWCENNNISKETMNYINNNIRHAQPARLVGGGEENLSGKYPSKKMGVTIQWESGKVEGPAVLMFENDEDVLEYYDQPNKIKLEYLDEKGRKRGVLYTPDFFVIRKESAGWEEWKIESDYLKVSKVQKWKFEKNNDGEWRCPPGERFAKDWGLTFTVCSNSIINWNLHRNYTFLDDYLRRKNLLIVSNDCLDQIKQVIFQEPGISLKELIEVSTNRSFTSDDIYMSIILGSIFVNLNDAPIAEPELIKVFLHKEHAEMYMNLIMCEKEMIAPSIILFEVGTKILWDNQIWEIINVGDTNVSLISEGKYNEVPRELFDKLLNNGKIVGEKIEPLNNDPIIDIITAANDEDYKVANYRLKYVKIYLEQGSKAFQLKGEPNLRKVRDWVSKFRESEKLFGNGYVGLLPNDKNKGNKESRFGKEVVDLMDTYIKEDYETMIQKNKSVVYGAFKSACETKGYIPPSLATFCKRIEKRPKDEQTRERKGKRAEYQLKTFYWELERTTSRHGDFPFNIAHLDHTELDIELVCSRTGKNLGKPYLSLLIDAFSRKVLAFYLSFDSPSYRSCLMVFRDCVRRFNRLPQQIVVDNGKEFHSVYFETLLAMYEREPRWRPPAKARYGSVLERLFGTTNSSFIHNLQGNTKIMKNVREVTKSVNPKNHAVWTLPNLSMALEEFFFELYETIEHPALGQTSREAFKSGLFYSGERKEFYIPFDKLFEVLTLPSTQSGEATIQQNGIKINYIYYWNEEFRSLHFSKMKVKVRFDPFNIGIAYAYVNKRWIKCISEYYSNFSNLSQKELKFITSEIKKSNQNHSKKYTITAQKIAKFINTLEKNDQYALLKAKVEETKKVIHLVFNNSDTTDDNPEIVEIENEKVQNQPKENEKLEIENLLLDVYGEF